MKKIYLHIGFEKTGSKSIQNFCARNSDALQEEGIHYLNDIYHGLVFASTHWPLASAFSDVPSLVPPSKKLNVPEAVELIVDLANKTPCESLIFSAEPFSSLLISEEKISAMKAALKDFDVKIIAYVRRQDNFFTSHISSYVKGGHSFLNSEHITMSETIVSYRNHNRYDYKLILSRWENTFGKENMIVRPFERESLFEGDAVADFLNIFGVNAEKFSNTEGRDNESLAIEALLFLNLINRTATFDRTPLYIRNVLPALQKYSSRRTGQQQLISNKHRLEIIKMYEASNNYVAEQYIDQCSKLFLQPPPDINEPWSPVAQLSHEEMHEIIVYLENANPGTVTKVISALSHSPSDILESYKKVQSELFPAYGNNPDK